MEQESWRQPQLGLVLSQHRYHKVLDDPFPSVHLPNKACKIIIIVTQIVAVSNDLQQGVRLVHHLLDQDSIERQFVVYVQEVFAVVNNGVNPFGNFSSYLIHGINRRGGGGKEPLKGQAGQEVSVRQGGGEPWVPVLGHQQ